jgi:hypothetical protein
VSGAPGGDADHGAIRAHEPASLVDALGDAGALETAADLAEGPLDALLGLEGAVREVPILGSVVGGIRAIRAGRDFLLARKIAAFLGETGKETTEAERQAFLVRLASDGKFKDRVVSNLWIMLERLDDIAKATFLSRAFAGYVRNLYSYEVFLALVAALDRCLISDLTKLSPFAGLSSDYPADALGRLTGCGLMRQAPILDTPGALRGIDPKTGKKHVGGFDVKSRVN